jgi:hypothetical protein
MLSFAAWSLSKGPSTARIAALSVARLFGLPFLHEILKLLADLGERLGRFIQEFRCEPLVLV